MPTRSLDGPGSTRTYTPMAATAASNPSRSPREASRAMVSGPRNSSVTASPSPIRSIAE